MNIAHLKNRLTGCLIAVVAVSIVPLFYLYYGFRQVNVSVLDERFKTDFQISHRVRDGIVVGHGESLFHAAQTFISCSGEKLKLDQDEFPISVFKKDANLYAITRLNTGGYRIYTKTDQSRWRSLTREEYASKTDLLDALPNVYFTKNASSFLYDMRNPGVMGTTIGEFYYWIQKGTLPRFSATVKDSLTPELYAEYETKIASLKE